MNVSTFVAGGAAAGMLNALDETVQAVFAEADGKRSLRRLCLTNTGNAIAHVKLMWSVRRWTATFDGTATDGDYSLTFTHPTLATAGFAATVERDTTPASNSDLAAAMETAVEVATLTDDLINATVTADSSNVLTIVTQRGVSELAITASAPAPGTLVVADALPSLAADLPDIVIGVPVGGTIDVDLGGVVVPRLWMAATTESGVGATAPNADLTGCLVW